jgi:hemerythrin superfamily protein
MPKRTSINDVKQVETLNDLEHIVKDKRNSKRADAKKERRNRHYVKVLIKHQLNHEGVRPEEDAE